MSDPIEMQKVNPFNAGTGSLSPPPPPPDDLGAPIMPDAAPIAEVVPDQGDGISQREADLYNAVCVDLNAAVADAESVVNAIASSTADEINAALGLANGTTDELMGEADNVLSGAGIAYTKLQNNLFSATDKLLSASKADLGSVGLTLPWSTVDMANAVEGDWMALVVNAVPQIASALGIVPDPHPGALPPLPQVPNGTVGNPLADWRPELEGLPSLAQLQPHVLPGAVPPVNLAQPCPPPQVNCPPPLVNVTVNVPPIVVPPCSPGTSPPAPPGDTTFNQDIFLAAPAGPQPAAAPAVAAPLLFPNFASIQTVAGPGGIYFNDIDACAKVEQAVKQAIGAPAAAAPGGGQQPSKAMDTFIARNLPFGSDAFKWSVEKGEKMWGKQPYDWMRDQWDGLISGKDSTLNGMIDTTTGMWATTLVSPTSTPNPSAALYYSGRLALANMAERKVGLPLTYLYQSDQYLLQYSNPQFLPNQIRTDSAYLNGQIDDGTWLCWTRANGNLPEPSRRVMLADQSKPGLMDIISLYRRGHLAKEDLPKRARGVGVLDPSYVAEWLEVTKALPGVSDLVRFMVRDAADENVAKAYNLDKDFRQKFTPQIETWAKALGIDPTFFQFEWRSHWRIPSYTQLTEMLSRLRPDRLEMKDWQTERDAIAAAPGVPVFKPPPPTVTAADVKEALEVDDLAPAWVDRMMAISYTPINRTDAIRAYQTGAFNDDQLYDAFQNARYSPRDAKIMLDYYRKDKARRQRNITGTWSPRKVLHFFKDKLLTREQATDLLTPIMPDARQVREVLDAATLEMSADLKRAKIRALKRAYMLGEFSDEQIPGALVLLGLDQDQASAVHDLWTVERDGRLRQPTVAQLSLWLRKAIISVEEARQRLSNLGYSSVDADRIIAAALKFEYGDSPPDADELSTAISDVVRNQKAARKRTDGSLSRRLRLLLQEAGRIMGELQRRRADAGEPPMPPVVIP